MGASGSHTKINLLSTLDSDSVYRRPINRLILTLCAAFALLLYMSYDIYTNSRQALNQSTYNLQIEELKGRIIYYDEVLTMSARMASLTGDKSWEDRYNHYVTLLDDALAEAKILAPQSYSSQLSQITSNANDKLVAMETQAFSALESNNKRKAADIMFSPAYKKQKDIYSNGITLFSVPKQVDLRLNQLRHQIIYLDEVLTMSALMAALTGDLYWEERYLVNVPILDSAIEEATQLTSHQQDQQQTTQTAKANQKLIAFEELAFDLVKKNRLSAAQNILLSNKYEMQKQEYAAGMKLFSSGLQSTISDTNQRKLTKMNIEIGILFLVFTLTAIATYAVLKQVHQLGIERENHNRALLRKTEELESFAYGLSHDLKAPLKTIQGFSQRLEKKFIAENNTELQTYSEQITKNALRLDCLVQDTLEMTKSENLLEDSTKIDFEQILASIQEQLSEINSKNPVQYLLNLKHNRRLYSQRTRIGQILANLISNSIKYAKPKENKPYVEISTRNSSKGTFELRIKDNGIGIPQDQHDKVFAMFFRANSDIAFGSGLGLHLVRNHVEKLGGNIYFSSSEEGTEFIIQLPETA